MLAAPAGLAGVIAAPLGLAFGPAHWAAAGVAVGLCVPAAFATAWLAGWLAGRHPMGGLLGMMVGVAARMAVAVGGGLAVFLVARGFRADPLGYWLWLLLTYLATLVAETAVLAGRPPSGRPAAGPAGGQVVPKG